MLNEWWNDYDDLINILKNETWSLLQVWNNSLIPSMLAMICVKKYLKDIDESLCLKHIYCQKVEYTLKYS